MNEPTTHRIPPVTRHETTDSRPLSDSARTRLGRNRQRAATERAALYEVLDGALVCHLGVATHDAPVVLPTGFGRERDTLYLHGSSGTRSLLRAGDSPVCVTVTLLDGIVYSRSLNHHSMNYRSAVVYGQLHQLTEPAEKLHGLRVLTEHLAPGSWDYARPVSTKELAGVSVLALELSEASVKIRTGGPNDDTEDVAAGERWAGVLPLRRNFGEPVPAKDLAADTPIPAHIAERTHQPDHLATALRADR